jgi:hypothetical protein
VLGGRTSAVAVKWGEGPAVQEFEVIQQDSAVYWGQRLQVYCAERVATTEPTDIDTENYQPKTGPPSTHDYSKS